MADDPYCPDGRTNLAGFPAVFLTSDGYFGATVPMEMGMALRSVVMEKTMLAPLQRGKVESRPLDLYSPIHREADHA
jgi:hypothetical protein